MRAVKTSSRYTPGKWTSGGDAALFVEAPQGTWKAMVHKDDSTWSVRGPDPDDPLHYAGGEVFTADPDVKKGDAEGRYAVAKKRARAYIMAQLSRSGAHHASKKKYPYVAYWVRSRGGPRSAWDIVPIYVLGTTTRADEGIVGHDLRARPLRLGKGTYTMVISPDDVEDQP